MSTQAETDILIADDEPAVTFGLAELLREEGFDTETAESGREALQLIAKRDYAVVLVDLMLPDVQGLQVLEEVRKTRPQTEVIIITGKGSIDTAVEAMKAGAYDYLTKPVEPDRLRTVVAKALEHRELVAEKQRLEATVRSLTRYDDLVGQDEKMQAIYRFIDKVADTTANVLITGESGTGKELVARAIHNKSSRREGPFVAVNCSAFPRDILENELFGHEKGAFTGALKEKAGCFELADGGTLFLDEIGEMPADTQTKLLRALEERRFRRLGGTKEIAVDVRVIAATNRDLKRALKEGALREDLYFRLSVMEIELPPLRERLGDVDLLAEEFLHLFNRKNNKRINGFSQACRDAMRQYRWPGNVRELKNAVEHAVILCNGEVIELESLPPSVLGKGATTAMRSDDVPVGKKLHEIEREVIHKTLAMTGHNKTRAAQILGISLKTLHNKLNKYYQEEDR